MGLPRGPIVSTISGCVEGLAFDIVGAKVCSFRNLPFGKPPTGHRRFLPPEPASPWTGIMDCRSPTNFPMQNLDDAGKMRHYTPYAAKIGPAKEMMSEDCLRLSVYTPHNFRNGKHPVMVWIYGGAFQMGASSMYDGSVLAAKHDVVVVIPNYRVGVFGFFSLGQNSNCPGNAGLFDQLLALRWVQTHIEAFGGDKNNVTIFGESAGGVSVGHHVNSPLSTGLFHKAISHSGQATLPKLFKRDLSRARENFLDILEIDERDPIKLLGILQGLPGKVIAEADKQVLQRMMAFDPTLDGEFIHQSPTQSAIEGAVNKVPYMIGCNDSEGQGVLTLLARIPQFETGMTEEMVKVMISNFLPRMSIAAAEKCKQACISFYANSNDRYKYSKAYGDVYRDSLFLTPAVNTAVSHSECGQPVYFYYGRFQLRMNHDAKYGPNVGKKPEWCYCDHSDDVFMVWGAPFASDRLHGNVQFSEDEVTLSAKCMTYITNFAKTGNPNVGERVDVQWPMFGQDRKYIEWNHDIKACKDLLPENVRFWSKTIYSIAKKYKNPKSNL